MIIEKNPIFQQAYLVNSIDESAKKWSDLYGAGPFVFTHHHKTCLLYTSPSPRDRTRYRMPSSA